MKKEDMQEKRIQKYIDQVSKKVRLEANEDIEKYLKKLNSDSDERMEKIMKRHIGALSEDFTHKLQVVTEVVTGHSDTLESIKTSIEEINTKLDRKTDLSYTVSLDKRITTLESDKK